MKTALCAALLVAALTGPSAAAVNSDAYFPLQRGFTWEYNTVNKAKKDSFVMKVTVEGPWDENGQSGVILTQKDTRGKMRDFWTRGVKGVFITNLGLSKGYTPEVFTRFSPPVPRVIYPLEPG